MRERGSAPDEGYTGAHADVAQLARASACHAEGRGFESHHPLLGSAEPREVLEPGLDRLPVAFEALRVSRDDVHAAGNDEAANTLAFPDRLAADRADRLLPPLS